MYNNSNTNSNTNTNTNTNSISNGSKVGLTVEELKTLGKLIEKTLKDKTYNKKSKEDLFIIREILCNNLSREEIVKYELDEYL